MAFNLGGFAGGVTQGVEEGQNIAERYQKALQAKRQDQQKTLFDQFLQKSVQGMQAQASQAAQPYVAGGGGAPPSPGGPPPGQPPMGGPPPGQPPQGMPRPMPMPGVTPMPQAQAQPPRPPMSPQGAPPPQGGPPSGMTNPNGPPPPSMGPQANVNRRPPDPFQGLNPNDPTAKPQAMLRSIAFTIAQQFPGRKWKPQELLGLVHEDLQAMNDVNPIDKQMATLLLKQQDEMIKERLGEGRIWASERNTDTRVQGREDVAGINAGARTGAAEIGAGARRYAADQSLKGAGERASASRYSADQGLEGREYSADRGLERGEYSADQGRGGADDRADASAYAAQVRNPRGAAKIPKPLHAPLPTRPGKGAAPAAGGASPPIAALKEGVHTKFANGQTWTLKNGKPVQVGG